VALTTSVATIKTLKSTPKSKNDAHRIIP